MNISASDIDYLDEAINRSITSAIDADFNGAGYWSLPTFGVFKLSPSAKIPTKGTTQSACFDVSYCDHDLAGNSSLRIVPGGTLAVPTGLIFDIPEGYVMKVYARSGLALKHGITLANGVGIIDSDYVDELKVLLHNHSAVPFIINPGDRIAQVEVVKVSPVNGFAVLRDPPQRKTNRDGGFGSTGVSSEKDKFIEHLEQSSAEVATWPEWKQTLLGGPAKKGF